MGRRKDRWECPEKPSLLLSPLSLPPPASPHMRTLPDARLGEMMKLQRGLDAGGKKKQRGEERREAGRELKCQRSDPARTDGENIKDPEKRARPARWQFRGCHFSAHNPSSKASTLCHPFAYPRDASPCHCICNIAEPLGKGNDFGLLAFSSPSLLLVKHRKMQIPEKACPSSLLTETKGKR